MSAKLSWLKGWLATGVIVFAALLVAAWMWGRYEGTAWTRNGRVQADIIRVAPDVGGIVSAVAAHEDQPVSKGTLLFVVDHTRYQIALRRAEAALAEAHDALAEARGRKVAAARAAYEAALADRAQALLDLERTNVRASVDGVVANVSLHAGAYVKAGEPVVALIDTGSLRIEGYFEETQLPLIRIGAPAMVRLMGEDEAISGRVTSIAAGINDPSVSTSQSLLPNVEPNFSWVRLAQRIPVSIAIGRRPGNIRLIVGRTATVTIASNSEQAR